MSTIVQQMYNAYFGRPADVAGLAHWDAHMAAHNNDPAAIINDFSASAEYQNAYDGQSYEFIVNSIYNNLFGRDAEPAGLVHFVNRLQSGENNIGDIAWQIMNDAQNSDRTTMANRATAAEAFTAALDTTAEILAYGTYEAGAVARAWLATVDDTAASLTAAEATLDATIQSIVDGTGTVGETFTLTTAIGEVVDGTENNDTFNVIADGAGATLNTFDEMHGNGGNDTLNYVTTTAPVALPTVAQMDGVETVQVSAGVLITALNASALTDVTTLNVGGAGATAITLGANQSVTLSNNVAAVTTVTDVATETEATVTLNSMATASTLTFVGAANTDLTLQGSIAGAAPAITFTAAATTTTLNLALESNVTFTALTGAAITTIDASESTGNLTFIAPAAVDTIFGGSGDDTITASALPSTLDAGAGADTITLSGAGDVIVVNAGDSGITFATADDVTGFVTATDSFDFNLVAGSATNFTSSLADDFLDALTTANTAFDGTVRYYVGDDGTDSYLFVDVDLDGTADMGITLFGVTGAASFVATDIIA